jgi:hypothetical protein
MRLGRVRRRRHGGRIFAHLLGGGLGVTAFRREVADLLLERQDELERAEAALIRAADGDGVVLLVEGPAGIGKTRFAQAVAEIAESTGFEVHWAAADEFERGFAYGVLRQLLVSMLGRPGLSDYSTAPDDPAAGAVRVLQGADRHGVEDGGEEAFAVDYGFYRLLHDLSDRRPRLVCVDDVHWADVQSLRALSFACRRAAGVSAAVMFTYRRSGDRDLDDLLERMTSAPNRTRLVLPPLGPGGVSVLAGSVLRHEPGADFCEHLLRLTGGNPFLVREMLAAAQAREPEGALPAPADLEQLVPAPVVESVRRRIAAIGESAERLAAAVAVLGEAQLRDAAHLAELDETDAVTAADRLAGAGVLSVGSVLRFVHPISRGAVRTQIPAAQAALAHARAARLLDQVGAPLEHVAAHLLEALPRADPWAAATLLNAAQREERRGSPSTAVPLLARAASEPPPPEQRLEVTLALAKAQVKTHHPEAVATAHRALDLAVEPREKAEARLQLIRTLGLSGDFRAGLDLLADQTTAGDVLDPDLALEAETELLGVARLHGAYHDEVLARLDALASRASPVRPASVVLLANLALSALERNKSPSRIAHLAELALSQGWLIREGSFQLVYAVTTLIWIDRLEAAGRACDTAVDAAAKSGSVSLSILAYALR